MSRAIILGKDTQIGCSATVVRPDNCWPACCRPIETNPTWWFWAGARRSAGRRGSCSALHAPLDAFIVRKLGVPGHEEFAAGALASGGRVVLNDDVVRGLGITLSNCEMSPNARGAS